MELKPLMTMHADLKEPVTVGEGPQGTRTIYDVTGCQGLRPEMIVIAGSTV